LPIDAPIELFGEIADLTLFRSVVGKIFRSGQHAGDKKPGIHRG